MPKTKIMIRLETLDQIKKEIDALKTETDVLKTKTFVAFEQHQAELTKWRQKLETERQERAKLEAKVKRAEAVEMLMKLPDYDLKYVRAALDSLVHGRGCTTPAEHFVETILGDYAECGSGLTPDGVKGKLEEFEIDFEDAVETTRRLSTAYADILTLGATPKEGSESHA